VLTAVVVGNPKRRDGPAWRVRLGEYRILYEIADERLIVLVIRIAKRSEAYR
jgi:mRNA interferase RelE/StbE